MTAVWEHSQHKGSALLLLLAIADHAHDDGRGAYPSVAALARKIRMSERQVQRILQLLEASEEVGIQWGEGPRGTNLITVRLHRLPPDKMSPRQDVTPTNGAAGGDKSRQGGDIAMAPEPSLNHQQPSEDDPTFILRVSRRYNLADGAVPTLVRQCTDGAGRLRRAAFEEVAFKNRGAKR